MSGPARSLLLRLARRLGRRGATLLSLAVVDFVWGWLLTNPDLHAQLARVPSYRLIAKVPLSVWGAVWICVGVVCAVQAWRPHDRLAFSLAITIKLVWAALILGAWLLYHAPLAWTGAILWGALAAWVATTAGWAEPPPPVPPLPPLPSGGR